MRGEGGGGTKEPSQVCGEVERESVGACREKASSFCSIGLCACVCL